MSNEHRDPTLRDALQKVEREIEEAVTIDRDTGLADVKNRAVQHSGHDVSSIQPTRPARRTGPPRAQHCALFAVDVAGFTDARRDDEVQLAVRSALYELLIESFNDADLPWDQCLHEDRGDGILVIIPASIPSATVVDPLVDHIRAGLRRYNRLASDAAAFKLRVAVHIGEVHSDAHGLAGIAVNQVFRLRDAPAFKRAFAAADTDLALIVSDYFYDSVVRHGPGKTHPAVYRPVTVEFKRTQARGWIHLPGATSVLPAQPRQRGDRTDGPQPVGTFWNHLNDIERSALRDAAQLRMYTPGMHLCYEGDPSDHVIIIENGWAKVTSITDDGNEVVRAIRGPGDIVGESAVLGHRPRLATTTALDSLRALVLSAGRFTSFLDEHPRVWPMVGGTLVRRTDDDVRWLRAKASADGAQRLAKLLLHLAEQYGSTVPSGGVVIQAPLSLSELASWVDSSRETVARAVKTWRSRGLVDTTLRKITILDAVGLRALAGDHPPARARDAK